MNMAPIWKMIGPLRLDGQPLNRYGGKSLGRCNGATHAQAAEPLTISPKIFDPQYDQLPPASIRVSPGLAYTVQP